MFSKVPELFSRFKATDEERPLMADLGLRLEKNKKGLWRLEVSESRPTIVDATPSLSCSWQVSPTVDEDGRCTTSRERVPNCCRRGRVAVQSPGSGGVSCQSSFGIRHKPTTAVCGIWWTWTWRVLWWLCGVVFSCSSISRGFTVLHFQSVASLSHIQQEKTKLSVNAKRSGREDFAQEEMRSNIGRTARWKRLLNRRPIRLLSGLPTEQPEPGASRMRFERSSLPPRPSDANVRRSCKVKDSSRVKSVWPEESLKITIVLSRIISSRSRSKESFDKVKVRLSEINKHVSDGIIKDSENQKERRSLASPKLSW